MLLQLENITIRYGSHRAVNQCSIALKEGEVVGLFGHNGAGKSSILKGILGQVPVHSGEIRYRGQPIANRTVSENCRQGIALVPQGFGVFGGLTVLENLRLGAYNGRLPEEKVAAQLEMVYELFPMLYEKRMQKAGLLSGGQQQMVKMGMGLMKNPELLLLDEPSLGLAPALADMVLEKVREINRSSGTSVLIVEQNVSQTLHLTHRVYFIRMGEVIAHFEDVEELRQREHFWEFF